MDFHQDELSEVDLKRTPQEDVISPLLMNVVFHGMEEYVVVKFGRNKVKVVRYENNFVIFGKTLNDV
jgi:retron-type reverse transcriptase